MKALITLLVVCFASSICFGQYGTSGSCQINVNDPATIYPGREGIIGATFKLSIDGFCTGTLINRNTSDGNVGYYFLTARHCITGLDFSNNFTLYFNFQSPDENSSSTPLSNQGSYDAQSGIFTIAGFTYSVDNGYEYRHETKLRLVADYSWGDFALIEILTPLPPHFNFTYAGWNPSRFYNGIGTGLPFDDYAGIHHPNADIKKISTTDAVFWFETPEATACYGATSIIDILFGWLWDHDVSTQVICNYVDFPWVGVAAWNHGSTEEGSSGSGLFNGGHKQIGALHFGASKCSFPALDFYGKLHANYYNSNVKNSMNPPNDLWVDLAGMGERKITCYESLDLPGAPGVSGQYFPAKHYQSDNHISLQAVNTIVTSQPINVFPEADYEFVAGQSITIGSEFHAMAGSEFVARIGSCGSHKNEPEIVDGKQWIRDKLAKINVPKHKQFTQAENLNSFVTNIYPNPTTHDFNIELKGITDGKIDVYIYNALGELAYKKQEGTNGQVVAKYNISNLDLPPGMYMVRIMNGDKVQSHKLVISKP